MLNNINAQSAKQQARPDGFARSLCAWLRQIAEDPDVPDSCCRLAIVLGIQYMNRAERCAWPSQETLARDTGSTAGTVSRQIAALVARGHLEVDAGAKRYGRGHTNRYRWRLKRDAKTPSEEKGFLAPETPAQEKGFRETPAPETPFLAPNKPQRQAHANHLKEPLEERYISGELDLGEKQAPERGQPRGDFEDWYSLYPLKKAKAKAERAYQAIIQKRIATPIELKAGAMRYAAERTDEDPKYTKHPATWLNGGCWKDEPDAPRPAPLRQSGTAERKSWSEVAYIGPVEDE